MAYSQVQSQESLLRLPAQSQECGTDTILQKESWTKGLEGHLPSSKAYLLLCVWRSKRNTTSNISYVASVYTGSWRQWCSWPVVTFSRSESNNLWDVTHRCYTLIPPVFWSSLLSSQPVISMFYYELWCDFKSTHKAFHCFSFYWLLFRHFVLMK